MDRTGSRRMFWDFGKRKIPLAVISGAAYAFSFSIYEIMEIPSLWKMFQVRGIPLEKLIYLGILAISFLRIAYLWIKKARYEMWKKPKKRKR